MKVKAPKTFGIKEGYPNLRRVRGKIADFFSLCRPFTLLGAWIAGFFLDLLFSKPSINLFHSTLVGFTLTFLQAGGQALNQSLAEEVEIDRMNEKTYRPTVDGGMTLKEGKFISLSLFSVGVSLAFYLNVNYGLFSLLIAFFAIAYTTPPFRMKRFFFLNNLWQGVARGLLPAVYVSSAYERLGFLPILYGIALSIWVIGAQTSKDFGDEAGDEFFNIRTFPVVLGRVGALRLMSIFIGLSFIVFNFFVYLKFFPLSFLVLNILAVPSALMVYGLKKGIKFKYAENTLGWVMWYGTLGLFYIFPVFLI